ncbi:MAG: 2-oxoacid:ferredoxin oxidoreductase subunit beta [Candidatus Eisenbacteria bacterium]|uniref:2-oxoacid:ferredoxin oxidoreductase subunit beta n=1 Tax=Eiseniibacteriota bacterium TaxID=2212470 RepID=A0A956LX58_UNCEI|nr:2-oxoacid:ferredoxin oxidoreductase subunit beta [Candidatus Eisenbacteria bacterium]
MIQPNPELNLTKKDFQSDQEVRWCPGCGDYAILNAVQNVFPELGIPRENFVIVSGIGCASRFPYYMNTYGFHTIHGRAPAVATGIKVTRPDLSVWVVSGDGDALSIGGNHLIHAMRRNADIKVLLFNNRIYGLTKGQASPASELGKRTKSSPMGTTDEPFSPLALALGANARFVARSVDVFPPHLKGVLAQAAQHKGSAFIEIFQNCNIFNDGAWRGWTERDVRDERVLNLEHGKPLVFGAKANRGIRLNGFKPEIVEFEGEPPRDLLVWDEDNPEPAMSFLMAGLGDRPGFPMPIGVFRKHEETTFETRVHAQVDEARSKAGSPNIQTLLEQGDVWTVS